MNLHGFHSRMLMMLIANISFRSTSNSYLSKRPHVKKINKWIKNYILSVSFVPEVLLFYVPLAVSCAALLMLHQ